jgi:hypothetical protein
MCQILFPEVRSIKFFKDLANFIPDHMVSHFDKRSSSRDINFSSWHWKEENCLQFVFGMKPLIRSSQSAAEKKKHSDFRGSKPYPGYRT